MTWACHQEEGNADRRRNVGRIRVTRLKHHCEICVIVADLVSPRALLSLDHIWRIRHGGGRMLLAVYNSRLSSLVPWDESEHQGNPAQEDLGLKIGTNRRGFWGGVLQLSDAESMDFHRVPNQVLYL